MEPKLKELQEKREKLAARIQELAKEANNGEWKDEATRNAWDEVNKDYDATVAEQDALLKKKQAADEINARANAVREQQARSVNTGRTLPGREDGDPRRDVGGEEASAEDRSRALAGWLLARSNAQTEDHRESMRRFGLRNDVQEIRIGSPTTRDMRNILQDYRTGGARAVESRALSAFTTTAGGYLVDSVLMKQLEVNMLAYGGMRQVAETIVTAGGETITWPTADDTSNTGEQLGESASIGSSVDPTFSALTWNAYKFSSKLILVPYELLQDSFLDLPGILGQMLGERLGRITNTKYTTGTGATTPYGIVGRAALGVTTASATAITWNEVLDLVHSIDPAYRATGCGFMMHDSIKKYLRKLQDSNGRNYWFGQFGDISKPAEETIYGYPVTNNQDMDSAVTTTKKTILFGRLGNYKIRRVNDTRLRRLDERYADTDQVAFVGFIREDGNLLSAGTAPVKYLQQA